MLYPLFISTFPTNKKMWNYLKKVIHLYISSYSLFAFRIVCPSGAFLSSSFAKNCFRVQYLLFYKKSVTIWLKSYRRTSERNVDGVLPVSITFSSAHIYLEIRWYIETYDVWCKNAADYRIEFLKNTSFYVKSSSNCVNTNLNKNRSN